jgi:hypothetical protein
LCILPEEIELPGGAAHSVMKGKKGEGRSIFWQTRNRASFSAAAQLDGWVLTYLGVIILLFLRLSDT